MKAEAKNHDVAVVELDAPTVAVLAGVRSPSLSGSFGDYRPPGQQLIGVGDAVQITLWEAGPGGLFSSPAIDRTTPGSRTATIPEQVVARDGAITVPFAGRVRVVGHTQPEIERIIVDRLTDKAIDPQALVTVTRNVSNTATVIGGVGPGARVPLSVRGDRLLDVIALAGGERAAAQDIAVVLARGDRTLRVPMQAVPDDPHENIYLQPDDVVTLVRDPQTFIAAGASGRNAVVPSRPSTSPWTRRSARPAACWTIVPIRPGCSWCATKSPRSRANCRRPVLWLPSPAGCRRSTT